MTPKLLTDAPGLARVAHLLDTDRAHLRELVQQQHELAQYAPPVPADASRAGRAAVMLRQLAEVTELARDMEARGNYDSHLSHTLGQLQAGLAHLVYDYEIDTE